MTKKPRNVKFRTVRQSNTAETKRFAAVLVGCVVLILAVSVLFILNKHDFDLKSALGGDAETETVEDETQSVPADIEASKTYLFWCEDSSTQEMRFAWTVNFSLPKRIVSVCTLDPDTRIEAGGESLSIRKAQKTAGIKEVVSGIEKLYGIELDGHIGSDDESFKSMVNYFGGFDVTVPEQIDYKSGDLSVILVKGKQNLKGDSLFRYMRYLSTQGERGRKLMASAIGEILDGVFKPSNTNRCANIFSRISNTLETDLTIVDFSSSEKGIKVITENGFASKRTLETPEE